MTSAELLQLKDNVCPCCMLDTRVIEYGLCDDLVDMGEMGSGYVLFFHLIKLCIWICFLFGLANIYKIVANSKGKNCFNATDPVYAMFKTLPAVCQKDWITTHSIANYGFETNYVDKWIMLGFFLLTFLILVFYYPCFSSLGIKIDRKTDMPSDWTIQVGIYDDSSKELPQGSA
jgi:hypothetical protein